MTFMCVLCMGERERERERERGGEKERLFHISDERKDPEVSSDLRHI